MVSVNWHCCRTNTSMKTLQAKATDLSHHLLRASNDGHTLQGSMGSGSELQFTWSWHKERVRAKVCKELYNEQEVLLQVCFICSRWLLVMPCKTKIIWYDCICFFWWCGSFRRTMAAGTAIAYCKHNVSESHWHSLHVLSFVSFCNCACPAGPQVDQPHRLMGLFLWKYLSIYLSIYLFIYLSMYLSIYLSIFLAFKDFYGESL